MQKDLVRRWYEEMWNRWNEAVFEQILDPEIEMRGSLGHVHHGFSGMAAYMRFVRDAFPDFHNEIEETVEEGDRVFVRLRYTGTHRGELFGIPATGRRIEYAGAALFRFRGDRIRSVWVLGDVDGLKRQLAGVGPA
jgi:steroid delta-isomerase-like uncharacterized protein